MWQSIVHSLDNSIIVLNPNNTVEYINPSGEFLFATSYNRIKYHSIFSFLNYNDNLLHLIETAKSHPGNYAREYELELILSNQQKIIVNCTATVLMQFSATDYILLEFHPIDWQLRLHKDKHAIERDYTTQLLIRNLAHEIKNPLSGLSGAAQLLEKILPDSELKAYTDIIKRESQRIANLVDDLLVPQRRPSRKTLINIHEILERVRHLAVAMKKNIKIMRDYDPSLPEIYADSDQLVQALLNIVKNAVQALDQEGRIILHTRSARQIIINNKLYKLALKISIIDNGKGIPETIQDSIFQPFVTESGSGSGLGLSIAKSLIQQHNGSISFQSEPRNTIFTITIPINSSPSTLQDGNSLLDRG